MRRMDTLTDLVMADDPPVALWGSTRRPQFGSREDLMREGQYDRECRTFQRMARNMAENARRYGLIR